MSNNASPDGAGSRHRAVGRGRGCSFQLRCGNIIRAQSRECRPQTPGPAKEPKGAVQAAPGHAFPLPPHRLVRGWATPASTFEQRRVGISNGSQDASSSPSLSGVHARGEEPAFGSDTGLSPASAAHQPCGSRQISYHSEPQSAQFTKREECFQGVVRASGGSCSASPNRRPRPIEGSS